MKVNTKRFLCMLFVCILLAGMMPMTALAATSNFTVTMKKTTDANLNLGETVSIPVVVGHTGGITQYNSFDMKFTYDPSILQLNSTVITGMSVTAENGIVRVLRYGNDLKVGATAFTLTFKAIKSGETIIKAVEAKVGIRQTAQEMDAADADILNDVTVTINSGRYNVHVATSTGGNVSVNPSEAAAGTRVVITVSPNVGNRLQTLTVTRENGENVPVSTDNSGTYSFIMPEENVTIKTTFTAQSTDTADTSNPKTSDDFNIAVYIASAMTSLLVLAVLILNRKKICRK